MRRVSLLAAGLAGLAALTSCSTFDTSSAATVNGDKINQSVIDTLISTYAPQDPSSNDKASSIADRARIIVAGMIRSKAAEQVADQFGIDLAAARQPQLAEIRKNLGEEALANFDALDPDEQALVADYYTATDALKAEAGNAPADLQQRYDHPQETGYFCIRYLALDSKAAADEAYQQLQSGADFVELANGLAPESNGGAVTGQDGNACAPLDNFWADRVPAPLTNALFSAAPGEPTRPVEVTNNGQTAWFVLLHRPWEEIGTDLAKKVSESPAYAEYLAEIATSDVHVDHRYGVWNGATASVDAYR